MENIMSPKKIVQKAKKLFPDHSIKLFYPKISASENNKEVIYNVLFISIDCYYRSLYSLHQS